MDNYMDRYKCEIRRLYNNCHRNDRRTFVKQHIDSLYSRALINYKEWSILIRYCDDYIDSQLSNK